MTVKVSPKYQVVIPEEVRRAVPIAAGSRVSVIAKGGVVFIVPVRPLSEVRKKLRGRIDARSPREKKDREV